MNALESIEPNQKIPGHVCLLGAGASFASCPKGDRNGRTIPLMRDLVGILEVENELRTFGFGPDLTDFESIYSKLVHRPEHKDFLDTLNKLIWEYFSGLELPEEPTVYDHLVLSLRPKDCIATFNWDPFLWQACARNFKHAPLPRTICLHGSVSLGYCQCEKPIVVSYIQNPCPKCREKMKPANLLYPVGEKDYNDSPLIQAAWQDMKTVLANCMLFTIFGYAAPVSDVEAVELLKNGWWSDSDRAIEQIEIIDIVDEKTLADRWDGFIYNFHYDTMKDFYSSRIWHHPRRSCEVYWSNCMELAPVKENRIDPNVGWSELLSHIKPLVEEEDAD